ncbi:type IX secretion system anionic LPS delivery protein PorZ [Chitinophaga japonensis]|uniref:Two component regulator with propeller domain n=1 Tax=Chitinophaga japonensis TaxID=104662 RepID=A0A562TDF6_CHIJA|nr:two-component regulator propeller domain-containing protein [Chitinophaga japonensis]TWI91413.1 two component regulator with propeller domain [Chitinophaga japonensis]
MIRSLLLLLLSLQAIIAHAQQVPLGRWREHLPYRQALAVVSGSNRVYCATAYNMFSVTVEDHDITRYSKLNGLHDANISAIGASSDGGLLVTGYRNGNVDLLQQERVYNLPDILRKNIQGDKTIHSIFFYQGQAWLATGFGIVVVNPDKREVSDTYITSSDGSYAANYAVTTDGQYFYAATPEGVRRAPVSGSNLASYQSWTSLMQGLQPGTVQTVAYLQQRLICRQGDSLFTWQQGSWQPWYADGWHINSPQVSGQQLLLCEQSSTGSARVLSLDADGTVRATLQHPLIQAPAQATAAGGATWIADAQQGLLLYDGSSVTSITPNAPAGIVNGRMLFLHNSLWATAGGVTDNWTPAGNRNGYYVFENEQWHNYNYTTQPYLDTITDLLPIAADANGTRYMGSFSKGLLALDANGGHTLIQQPVLPAPVDDPQACRVSGLATDAAGNLWLSSYGAERNVLVKKPDDSWLSFRIPYAHAYNAVSDILVDDHDQLWILSPGENGLFVFNHGGSLENTADDQWTLYRSGADQGNLPSNDVRCLAKDKDGWIWAGTTRGIAIFPCAGAVSSTGCSAYLPVVQEGNFAGYLFRDEQVNTIAVDGANQKWVGTLNGVWLINASGEQILAHFNTDNSPLPDNAVNRITVNPATGEVFFATRLGLVSFRGNATEGVDHMEADSVLVFPNPVPPGYSGTIAIRGLSANARVKITDIRGRLVFDTHAQGGQAVWNGLDYTGHRPQSGVYLVFAADENGRGRLVTKIVFIN